MSGRLNDLTGGTLFHNHAAIHKDDFVCHIPGKGHFVGDDNHGGLPAGQIPDDPQHLSGQLRVQCRGGLVEAENIRLQGQRPGNGDPLLLAAGQLMGIVSGAVGQSHGGEELQTFLLDALLLFFSVCFPGPRLLGEKGHGQAHIFQGSILGEQVEGLKYQSKVQAFFSHLPFLLGSGIRCIKDALPIDGNGSSIGDFQKIQTTQQGGFTTAGGTDNGQCLPLFQGKADILQHLGGTEAFL